MASSVVNSQKRIAIQSSLHLPDNYQARNSSSKDLTQTHPQRRGTGIYLFGDYLLRETNLKYVIDIGCGFGFETNPYFSHCGYLGIGDGKRMRGVVQRNPEARIICNSLTSVLTIDENILKESVVVCDGILNELENPIPLLTSLKNISKIAPFVLIGAPDRERLNGFSHMGPPQTGPNLREWSSSEFYKLLSDHGIECQLFGNTIYDGRHSDKIATLAISGTHANYRKVPQKKVVAILSCFNDEDILIDVAEHLLKEGLHIWFLDNWSSDKTWDIIQTFKQHMPERIVTERFPASGPDKQYQWQLMLERKAQIAAENGDKYDWFVHHDSDEIRTSPWPGVTTSEAISFVHSLGYNAINHLFADFRPTKDGFTAASDVKSFFTHFEFNVAPSAYIQKRAWAHQPKPVELIESGGHDAVFEGRNTYPLRFLIQHFSLRSTAQAARKVFKDRLPRFGKEERERGWHVHYDHYKKVDNQKYIWKTDDLIAYSPVYFKSEYIIERLAALNLKHPVMRKPFDWHWD